MTTSGELLTPRQVAEYLQIDRGTVYRYIRDGRLSASRVGRVYRVAPESVRLFLWASRTRDDIRLRDYSRAELDAFFEADRLDDDAKRVVERLEASNLGSGE